MSVCCPWFCRWRARYNRLHIRTDAAPAKGSNTRHESLSGHPARRRAVFLSSACRSAVPFLQPGRLGRPARPGGPLSRSAAHAHPGGGDVPGRRARCGRLVARQCALDGRRGGSRGRADALASQPQGAARVSGPARAHGREPAMDGGSRRRFPHAGTRGDGDGPGASLPCASFRRAAAAGVPASRPAGSDPDRLCPLLQPARGLRALVVAFAPAGGMASLASACPGLRIVYVFPRAPAAGCGSQTCAPGAGRAARAPGGAGAAGLRAARTPSRTPRAVPAARQLPGTRRKADHSGRVAATALRGRQPEFR